MSAESSIQQQTDGSGSPKGPTPSSPPSGSIELTFQANEAIGQTSPPHNSYRHSRAYRNFKNPPQPHMCIRVTTASGEELFINVLSWTRIVIPQEPSDPIPLYGGMKVPPGSPRCPPLVYAVMANPEVLKDSGRHSKDPEERRAMVELMCDFVEAMNPDVKLTRNAIILKDRDISGELKDVWNAVQAQRDREREEEFARKHGLPSPDSIFYKGALRELQDRLQKQQQHPQSHPTHNSNITTDNKVMYMEFGPESAPNYRKDTLGTQQSEFENRTADSSVFLPVAQSAITNSGTEICNQTTERKILPDIGVKIEKFSSDMTDSIPINQSEHHSNVANNLNEVDTSQGNAVISQPPSNKAGCAATCSPIATIQTLSTTSSSCPQTPTVTPTAPVATTPVKKEKLGFLPNGCHSIFPRFKNNKHKDKEKDKVKEKESNKSLGYPKEKTLLNSFKKTTTAAANVLTKSQQDDAKNHDKGCLLNAEMEKLDINKLDSSDVISSSRWPTRGANDVLFFK